MYVCLCNGFTDRCVDRAIENGAKTLGQVYKQIGAAPDCGRCGSAIRERLQTRVDEARLEAVA